MLLTTIKKFYMLPTLCLCVLGRFQIQALTFTLFDINKLVFYNHHGESLLHGMRTVQCTFCL